MFLQFRKICNLYGLLLLFLVFGVPCSAEALVTGDIGESINQKKVTTDHGGMFTEEEQIFLSTKKQITMCVDPDWMPLEKIENGQHVGMSADYFTLIEEKLGIPVVLVPTQTWSESIEYAKTRKCDIFSLAMATPERLTYMDFTVPYLSIPLVLATRNTERFIADLTSVQDELLGVVKGYAFGELLRSKYPEMQIVDVASVDEGLRLVNRGKIYGFIGTLATVSSTIQKGFSDELKIVGKFDERWELGVATRNDQPILLSIFNKVINSLDKREHQQILNRWISVKYEKSFDYRLFWRIFPFIAIGVLFLLFRYYTLGKYNRELKEQNIEILRQGALLKKTEEKLLLTQYAVDSCAYPIIWTKNAPLLEDTRIIHVNNAAANILGYSKTELLSLGIHNIDVNITEANWPPAKKSYSVRTNYRRKDGSLFPVELYLSYFEYQGQSYYFAFFTDISIQKKMEDQLHRSLKMEAVGMMAGGVAHDLNNILSGIVSYPELLLLKLPPDSELRKPLQLIEDSGKRAAAMVADMLTVARGAAAVREPENLNSLIESYFNSPEYKELLSHHEGVVCERELEPDLLNISCSAVHIRKCIMNLVANAMESLEDDGVVKVTTCNVYIDKPVAKEQYMAKGEYVKFTIADTGKGISESDLKHIFEPFYTKKDMGRSGTGLGLTVVWNSVQDHNGVITVESNSSGTTFSLYFPATRENLLEQIESMDLEGLVGDGEHILIVDDEPLQLHIAQQMLSALGYRIFTASSGEEAIQHLKENRVDLMLLDMIMEPGINGYETFLRSIEIQADLKAIVVSGFSENNEVYKAQALGAGVLVRKPYGMQQIGKAVRQALA
ncbi:PAS domain S-box [Desulfocapsa sulfexigens DSM 10523]|uniref:histidine kinase n=1 Tax=Desulfocapsa sulfexigens (strain DSM 10523 / SB164P1) TaxID=1167006 RepID=M1NJU4_DESSD|nr:transporter substrate-binding domain-containing protein [Desulfocapsa sulfexigens]AGF79854.1 PAS domain S-box [Desulfocapsa sulfexigens DSM 10523]